MMPGTRLDRSPLLRGGFERLHHPVDEQSQAALGRDAPRAGMRAGEQAQFFQLLHYAADGCGR